MIFEGLADKLQDTFDKLRGKGKLSEKDVKSALREVKLALLEADVNFKVVKEFISDIEERAVGKEVMDSLTPAQQVIKIVNEELTELMGKTQSKLSIASDPPTVIMLVGLQGAGKTTTVGKLAQHLHKNGRRPLLVAGDVYRPAAIKQLQVLGERLDQPVFSMGDKQDPVDIAKAGVSHAKSNGRDVVIIDTAGRLHIDEELMDELKDIKSAVNPQEILLVVDAMTGQDAVNVADSFNEALGIDGITLTKLDGDARGGAALSIRKVTGRPIKFVGTGEKLDDLEPFHPDRMASRILGMGDMLSLIEKAEENIDAQKAKELEEKLRKEEFTLEDFMDQMGQIRNMGPLDQIMDMIPGMGKIKQLDNLNMSEEHLDQIEAIVNSMTTEEKRDPSIINGSRRRRIANGSGTEVQDVNQLLKQFKQAKKMMKQLNDMQKGMGGGGGLGGLGNKFPFM
ncbi:signal recognition particle protein [Sporohalobacter salinus]|uniref:signal recognition particle protein n=1 Tax=Sporohalobacter salinus TaxID=1494606 RepID=UPI0019611D1A|nr:signal recognition particle subunit SRP54 [Sporohalobacter salinus]